MTTITLPRAVVEQALEALERIDQADNDCDFLNPSQCYQLDAAMTALRAALAQQAEPVNVAGPAHLAPKPAPGLEFDERGVLVPQQTEPVAWLRVIDEAMVTHHLGVADPGDDYETAKRKMNNLLCMAQDIGTYFAKQAEREACAKVCDFEVARLTAIDEPRAALAVGICAAAIRARGQA